MGRGLVFMHVLAYISTRGRYNTTLLASMFSVINQTRKPDKFILFDDNDKPVDLRDDAAYSALFRTMDKYNIAWEVIFGARKGQHFNHQIANQMDFDWCWRVDDDVVVDCKSLENMLEYSYDGVGAIGGEIHTPSFTFGKNIVCSGKIEDIYSHANVQWFPIEKSMEVDHLHCSFMYRPKIANYNLQLSKVAHREETLFTYDIKKNGYVVLVIPGVVAHHLKAVSGGIRDGREELYKKDEEIFRAHVDAGKLIVLDSGMGDHLMFQTILPEVKEKYGKITIANCYPELFPDENSISIAQAIAITNIEDYNIYKKCTEWNWQGKLTDAYRRLYL